MRAAQHGWHVLEAPPLPPRWTVPFAVRPAASVLIATSLALLVLVAMVEFGPLTHHMSVHIVLMGLAAPAMALALSGRVALPPVSGRELALATALQIAVLWGWHIPAVLDSAMSTPGVHGAMLLSTTVVAIWFWRAVICTADQGRGWQSVAALAITAKLFCIPAAILVFASRPIYACASSALCAGSAPPLDDQQLAGLLMLTACPLTYLTAGVVIVARWLRDLREEHGPSPATER